MRPALVLPAVAIALFAAACAPIPTPTPTPTLAPKTGRQVPATFIATTFSELQGWNLDRHGEAVPALKKSCAKLMTLPDDRSLGANDGVPGGRVKNWRGVCDAAKALDVADNAGAKRFFETWFAPYEVQGTQEEAGLFTGYYEPELNGARTRGGAYQTPLLARPSDLVSVGLGAFDTDLGGNTVWGRVKGSKLKPYPDRAAIEDGALGALGKPLLWVDSPVDAFFLHVQGSGRVRLADGTVTHVGFAGKNGKGYKSIGRILIDSGEIPANRLTMDAIRKWVDARPVKGPALLKRNPSYVFFRLLSGDGPLGAQGVALTAERSLAVDRRYLPLGVPLWLQTHDPLDGSKGYNRLMVAQDTGGAIKGAVRGDIFFGAGDLATRRAGNMKRPGHYFILLPLSVIPVQS